MVVFTFRSRKTARKIKELLVSTSAGERAVSRTNTSSQKTCHQQNWKTWLSVNKNCSLVGKKPQSGHGRTTTQSCLGSCCASSKIKKVCWYYTCCNSLSLLWLPQYLLCNNSKYLNHSFSVLTTGLLHLDLICLLNHWWCIGLEKSIKDWHWGASALTNQVTQMNWSLKRRDTSCQKEERFFIVIKTSDVTFANEQPCICISIYTTEVRHLSSFIVWINEVCMDICMHYISVKEC